VCGWIRRHRSSNAATALSRGRRLRGLHDAGRRRERKMRRARQTTARTRTRRQASIKARPQPDELLTVRGGRRSDDSATWLCNHDSTCRWRRPCGLSSANLWPPAACFCLYGAPSVRRRRHTLVLVLVLVPPCCPRCSSPSPAPSPSPRQHPP
jgi:hypothetical protein